jgi:hypothetical protein
MTIVFELVERDWVVMRSHACNEGNHAFVFNPYKTEKRKIVWFCIAIE